MDGERVAGTGRIELTPTIDLSSKARSELRILQDVRVNECSGIIVGGEEAHEYFGPEEFER